MGRRREMNLKHVNSLNGTGTDTNEDPSYSPTPFVNYLYTMVQILLLLFFFCFMTTNNYLNAKYFDEDTDYPVGTTLKDLIKKNKNPYCSSFADCSEVPLAESETVSKLGWWFQTTQESCYRVAGMGLHYYLKFLQDWCTGGKNGIPYTGYISFARWTIFGILTLISIVILFCIVWFIFLPGWFGGLFAFWKLQTNDIQAFALFCFSVFLTFCFGWVCVFPVIYEFFQLMYLFFQLLLVSLLPNMVLFGKKKHLNVVYLQLKLVYFNSCLLLKML